MKNGGRHVFVTTNEGFARLPKKLEFANAVIMTPTQAVQVLAGDNRRIPVAGLRRQSRPVANMDFLLR